MMFDQTFYALVALVIFLGIVFYAGAHKKAGAALDNRANLIAKELADAKKLRMDAEMLLADYKQKRVDAEKEAANIIAQAKSDAVTYAEEARNDCAPDQASRAEDISSRSCCCQRCAFRCH
jgi:F-type H+-transporting ATPase subunit b